MTEQYKIVGVELAYSHSYQPLLLGFRLDGVEGVVDFEANHEFEHMKKFKTSEEKVQWAKNQIGKSVECESLKFFAITTEGPTRIVR